MQKRRFLTALARVVTKLRISSWVKVLSGHVYSKGTKGLTDEDRSALAGLVFDTRLALSEIVDSGGVAADLLEGFGLQDIFSQDALAAYLATFQTAGHSAELREDKPVQRLLMRLEEFEKISGAAISVFPEAAEAVRDPETEAGIVLSLEIISGVTTPERFTKVLEASGQLHNAIARMSDTDAHAPEIAYLDSGSPLVVGIKMDGTVVTKIRKAFTDIIEFLRFWQLRGIERSAETAIKEIGLLRELKAAEDEGAIESEEAARARHEISTGLRALLEARALPQSTTGEIDQADLVLLQSAVPTPQIGAGEGSSGEPADVG